MSTVPPPGGSPDELFCDTVLGLKDIYRLDMGLTVYEDLFGGADSVEAARIHLARNLRLPDDGDRDEAVDAAITDLGRQADRDFVAMTDLAFDYWQLARRLRLSPAEVSGYLRTERVFLARLYHAAAGGEADDDELRRKVFQVCLDVRTEVTGSPLNYVYERYLGARPILTDYSEPVQAWRIAVLDDAELTGRAAGLPLNPRAGYVTHLSPFGSRLLWHLSQDSVDRTDALDPTDLARRLNCVDRVDRFGLASTIGRIFGGRPTPQDAAEDRTVVFRIEQDLTRQDRGNRTRLGLCVAGREVDKINHKDVQNLLLYFCGHPGERLSGKELKLRRPQIKNPSQAAKRIRTALAEAAESAADWFLTNPLGWAEGVRVRELIAPAASNANRTSKR